MQTLHLKDLFLSQKRNVMIYKQPIVKVMLALITLVHYKHDYFNVTFKL